MARNPTPFLCDACGNAKTVTNGWFLIWSNNGEIQIMPWKNDRCDDEGVMHVCGISCVLKIVNRELDRPDRGSHHD